MQKKMENVVASTLALIGRPSETKLSRDDLRLLVHNNVEKFTNKARQEREDWWTHIEDATVAYQTGSNYYTFTLSGSITEYYPISVYFQPTTSDRNSADWYLAKIVTLDSYPNESNQDTLVIAWYGNNYDTIGGLRCMMNVSSSWASQHRWRLQFRRAKTTAPAFTETVPFPYDYMSLIEYAVAEEALTMIQDPSEDFQRYVSRRQPYLMQKRLELEADFMQYIKEDAKAIVISNPIYNYKRTNKNRRGYGHKVEG